MKRVEWYIRSEDITALLAELYGTEHDVVITDIDYDELADMAVIGLEVHTADWKRIDLAAPFLGEFEN